MTSTDRGRQPVLECLDGDRIEAADGSLRAAVPELLARAGEPGVDKQAELIRQAALEQSADTGARMGALVR